MTIYFDICCLKRPFDDQTQPRIAVETTAVLAILEAVSDGRVTALRSSAHDLENSQNPNTRRATAVKIWLNQLNPPILTPPEVTRRANDISAAAGITSLDAVHVAWAENLKADYFLTVDDRLLSRMRRHADIIMVKATGPVDLLGVLPT